MEYEEFIQLFTHEVSYNLKMLGVPWRAKYDTTGGRENVLVVIHGGGHDFPPIKVYDYFQEFLQGMPWGVAARKATQDFFDDEITKCALKDMELFHADMVIPTFMNAEKNEELLKSIPYSKFEDLAVILQIVYQSLGSINLNLGVTDDILQEWGLGYDELYQMSLNNPRNIESVQMIELYKMMGDVSPYEAVEDLPPFYVVTNTGQHLGAASILYKARMHELAETMGDNILLVPMSTDHFLAMPLLDHKGIDYISNVLHSNNEVITGSIKPLSENLYHYNCKTEQFRMIAPNQLKETKKRGR
ncbi:TPA: hypothetical protein KO032_001133 [Clostridioides difficile]|nr:hypothetical protein [Clostridioides difficile]